MISKDFDETCLEFKKNQYLIKYPLFRQFQNVKSESYLQKKLAGSKFII